MLTQLRFQNFKSWKDTGEIRMAPLTGLFGTNSSGKTAILQFLLMLKQTVESSDRARILHLGDARSYVNLGTSVDIIHRFNLDTDIGFSFKWVPEKPVVIPAHAFELFHGNDSVANVYYDQDFEFQASISISKNDMSLRRFSYVLNSLAEDAGPISCGMQGVSLAPNSDDSIESGEFFSFIGDETWKYLDRNKDFPATKFYGFPSIYQAGWMSDILLSINTSFESLFRSVYYLGPLREYPQRTYSWSGEKPEDVGRKGESFVSCLLASERSSSNLQKKVGYWLKELSLVSDFQLKPIKEGLQLYELRIKHSNGSIYVPITDVGFGVSQILPVLTLCYYAPEGSTIIFEQPEIHLHPSAQAGLADMFIDVMKTRNIQLILESHSEHLLRRFQRRIAEEQLDNDSAALYFCNMGDDGASTLLPLELDTYGNINNWPKGFFGDEMGELFAMSEAAFERQMRDKQAS